jgi:hypothetical protein
MNHPVTHAGQLIGAWLDRPAAITALQDDEPACSSSQADLPRIAAGLGADLPLTPHHVLGSLDHPTITTVTAAT